VIHARQDTPEMRAVFEEVRASLAEVMERGEAPPVDANYLAAACIGLAREVGVNDAATPARRRRGRHRLRVRMILGGLPAQPRLPDETPLERIQRPARRAEDALALPHPSSGPCRAVNR
jgi:hypothetical protein